jgi:hypothetical protein
MPLAQPECDRIGDPRHGDRLGARFGRAIAHLSIVVGTPAGNPPRSTSDATVVTPRLQLHHRIGFERG